uniref:Candidate secreted effector n=1 Tax=Meloidogyne incognita TaxID=6306 RepID=A0A914LFD4_MELIC
MAEEGSSNLQLNLIDLSSKFVELYIKFNEEKEKTVKFEKELNKIHKINSDHEKEINNLKQNIEQLKAENIQKDEKISSLEEEIKQEIKVIKKKMNESQNCPKCRVDATLDSIKQHIEETDDCSDEAGDGLTQNEVDH